MRPINKKHLKAFTMIELIFVIVIMGIIGKFGTEFLAEAYKSFIYSSINNRLQANSATAVEFVSKRLQYRIKASTIARESNGNFTLLSNYYNATAPVLEWIGSDVDGFRGNSDGGAGVPNLPNWSGVIDLNLSVSDSTKLFSPATDTGKIDALIKILSNDATSGMSDVAIYFVNPDAIQDTAVDRWGWDANASKFDTQSNVQIHPVDIGANVHTFLPVKSDGTPNDFTGVTAFEYYQLAWSAYAVGISDWNATTQSGTLTLWSNYQPWKGESYNVEGTPTTIMQGVSSFRFIATESVVKVQVCVNSDLLKDEDGEYSVCKEKTVF